jgi:hypothetical protein
MTRQMVERMVANSNVVINLCGPKEESQAAGKTSRMSTSKVARNVAKACKNNPNVIRLIHFSSAAERGSGQSFPRPADQILRRTRGPWTSFRTRRSLDPTQMYGYNDYLIDRFRRTVDVWYNAVPSLQRLRADCRQPIYLNDVAQCVLERPEAARDLRQDLRARRPPRATAAARCTRS